MPPSTLNSLGGCWRSTAIPARGSISIEADGKGLCCSATGNALGRCQFVVDTTNPNLGLLARTVKPTHWPWAVGKEWAVFTAGWWARSLNSWCSKQPSSLWVSAKHLQARWGRGSQGVWSVLWLVYGEVTGRGQVFTWSTLRHRYVWGPCALGLVVDFFLLDGV